MSRFPHYYQLDAMDCGPSCIRMVAKHFGGNINPTEIKYATQIGKDGTSILGIFEAAEFIGFKTVGVNVEYKTLKFAI